MRQDAVGINDIPLSTSYPGRFFRSVLLRRRAPSTCCEVENRDHSCQSTSNTDQRRQSGGELDAACVVYGAYVGDVAVRTDKH